MRSPSPRPPRYLTAEQTRRVYDRVGRIQDLQAVCEHRAITTLLARTPTSPSAAPSARSATAPALSPNASFGTTSQATPATRASTSRELATRRLDRYADRVELRLGSALLQLPYSDASFDRFLAAYVLDLLSPEDITRTLAQAHRVLAPGGLLCLASLTTGTTRPSRLLTTRLGTLWSSSLHGSEATGSARTRPSEKA